MKLNKFATFAVAVAVMAFGFVACNNNNEVEAQRTYSDEEILAAVRFVGQGGAETYNMLRSKPSVEVTIMVWEFGRISRDCDGFGICRITIGPWDVWGGRILKDPNLIAVPYTPGQDLSNLHLLLAEQPGIDMRHVLLAVEKDVEIIRVTDSSLTRVGTVPAQNPVFNSRVGDYGGFELRVVPSEPVLRP